MIAGCQAAWPGARRPSRPGPVTRTATNPRPQPRRPTTRLRSRSPLNPGPGGDRKRQASWACPAASHAKSTARPAPSARRRSRRASRRTGRAPHRGGSLVRSGGDRRDGVSGHPGSPARGEHAGRGRARLCRTPGEPGGLPTTSISPLQALKRTAATSRESFIAVLSVSSGRRPRWPKIATNRLAFNICARAGTGQPCLKRITISKRMRVKSDRSTGLGNECPPPHQLTPRSGSELGPAAGYWSRARLDG